MTPELKLYIEDLMGGVPGIPDCSVDVIVTSPPYKRGDGCSIELMQALAELAGRVLRPGGRFFMDFGQLRENFDMPNVAQGAVKEWSGLQVGQTIAWVKSIAMPNWRRGARERLKAALKGKKKKSREELLKDLEDLKEFMDGPGEVYARGHASTVSYRSPTLTYCWEPIYTFYKEPELPLNRLAIGCEFADKSNLKRGTRGQRGDLKCAGDVWFVPYETTGAKKKKATSGMGDAYAFPVEIPLRAIKLSNVAKGCVVLDPFMGSGTTAVAAKRLGMHAWGVEVDARKRPVIESRWENERVGDDQVEVEAEAGEP